MKVLLTFEEEFVERQEQKESRILEINGRVKDAIRFGPIKDIIFVLE